MPGKLPNNMQFVGERSGSRRCINLFAVCANGPNGAKAAVVIESVKLVTITDGNTLLPEMMSLDFRDAQNLMDELYACGMRPSQVGNAADVVTAKNEHIADLQLQTKNMWIRESNYMKLPPEENAGEQR